MEEAVEMGEKAEAERLLGEVGERVGERDGIWPWPVGGLFVCLPKRLLL